MARVQYKNWAVDASGAIVASAAIELRQKSDDTLATLYTTETGGTTKTNPFNAETDGSFSFWAERDRYDLLVGSGASQETIPLDLVDARNGRAFSTRDEFVTAVSGGFAAADGAVVFAGGLTYVAEASATAISDLAGWVPFGRIYPDHFARNTAPGTTDMTAAIQAAIDYAESFSVNARKGVHFFAVTYIVSATLTVRESSMELIGNGCRIKRSTDYGDTLQIYSSSPSTTRLSDIKISGFFFEMAANMTTGAHLHISDVIRLEAHDITAWNGFIGFRLRGVQDSSFINTQIKAGTHWTTPPAGSRFVLIQDAQNSANETSELSFSDFNWTRTGDVADEQKVQFGLKIEAGDGIWLSNGHIFGATQIARIEPSSTSRQLQGIKFSNVWLDQWCDYHVYVTGNTTAGYGNIDFDGCKAINAESMSIYVDATATSLSGMSITGGRFTCDTTASYVFYFAGGKGFSIQGPDLFSSRDMSGLTAAIRVGASIERLIIGGATIGTSSNEFPIGILLSSTAPASMHIGDILFDGVDEEIRLTDNLTGGQVIDGCSTTRSGARSVDGDPTLSLPVVGSTFTLTGALSDVTDIDRGWDGRRVLLLSDTSTMTYKHNTGSAGTKIICNTGADIAAAAGTMVEATYHADLGAWWVKG